jgi:hypothetical protein
MKIRILTTFLLLMLSSSTFASANRCILKVQIKIEKSGNPDYQDCIGDSVEISDNAFLTKKKHVFKNISRDVCKKDVAAMIEGQEVVVPFTDSIWPVGFDPKVSYCTGTVLKVLSVKYRSIL